MRACSACSGKRGVYVTLTPDQEADVVRAVDAKLAYVRAHGRRQRFRPVGGETEESVNLQAHAAEFAFSLWSGLPWSPLFVPGRRFVKLVDVGPIEVRFSKHPDACLVLRDDDEDRPFVLVTGKMPTFRLAGWAIPSVVRVPKFWRVKSPVIPYPGYFVPQSVLHDLPIHVPSSVEQLVLL